MALVNFELSNVLMDKLFLPQGSLAIDELETPIHVPELFLSPVIELIPPCGEFEVNDGPLDST